MTGQGQEIDCTACGAVSWLRREAVYEGFRRRGDRLFCMACGHEFDAESDVPFKTRPEMSIFEEADRPVRVDVFAADEKGRTCRHCRHYVVNPFAQRCGRHNRFVEATDGCADFEAPEGTPPHADNPSAPGGL